MNPPIYPRSPREVMSGWTYLPRLVDKIRLHLAGKLHPDYQANFCHKGFDVLWFQAAGVTPEQLVGVVRGTLTDGEVADWTLKNVHRNEAQKAAHREAVLNHGRQSEELQALLLKRKTDAGLAQRDDITCFVDFIDADEQRG